jgi:hypothetical protein
MAWPLPFALRRNISVQGKEVKTMLWTFYLFCGPMAAGFMARRRNLIHLLLLVALVVWFFS